MTYTSPGRPTELTKKQLAALRVLYKNNISAADAAKHLKVSRQRVYYYYNHKFNHITQNYRPTIATLRESGELTYA